MQVWRHSRMHRSIPLTFTSLFLVLTACAGASRRSAAPPPGPPQEPSYAAAGAPGGAPSPDAPMAAKGMMQVESVDSDGARDEVVATAQETGVGASSPAAPTPTEPQANTQDMFDIEARLSIEVEKVGDAANRVRDIARKHGGQIVADTVNDSGGSSAASFTLRIPSKGSE